METVRLEQMRHWVLGEAGAQAKVALEEAPLDQSPALGFNPDKRPCSHFANA